MSTANFLGAVGLFTVTGAACSQSLARTSPLQALIRTRVTAIIKSLTMTRTLPTRGHHRDIEAGVIKRDKFKIVYVEHGADEGSCYEDDS